MAQKSHLLLLFFLLPAQEIYEENKVDSPIMWPISPESIIQPQFGLTLGIELLPFWIIYRKK